PVVFGDDVSQSVIMIANTIPPNNEPTMKYFIHVDLAVQILLTNLYVL
ncbi:unnamed protein product, partial [Rotaria socialis]